MKAKTVWKHFEKVEERSYLFFSVTIAYTARYIELILCWKVATILQGYAEVLECCQGGTMGNLDTVIYKCYPVKLPAYLPIKLYRTLLHFRDSTCLELAKEKREGGVPSTNRPHN